MINKLLLIDDDELTSFLLKKLVKGVGGVREFVLKENGLEAIEYLADLRLNGEAFPQLILLDIDMPVMNGYEFVELFEKLYWQKDLDLKLIMITSSKRQLDFKKCLSFKSVSDCIYKPLTREKMENILEEVYLQQAK